MLFPDWQAVRRLSRLSILSRVAFTMLFLVPLLAGFLHPLRLSVGKANEALDNVQSRTQTVNDIARGARALAGIGHQIRNAVVGESDGEDDAESSDVQDGSEWDITTPNLPRPWAMAFTAALLILLADTVFQILCPNVVRKSSLEDYVRDQSIQFSNHPSYDVLEHAHKQAARSPSASELLQREKDLEGRLSKPQEGCHEHWLRELGQVRVSLVEHASRTDFLNSSQQNRLAAWFCLAVYVVASCIVIKILQEQTVNVFRSAGWWLAG